MSIKVGINGFGRIGKGIFRIIEEMKNDDIQVVAIKDLSTIKDHSKYIENIAYLLKYDSIYGEFSKEVSVDGTNLVIDGRKVPIFLGIAILMLFLMSILWLFFF